MVRGDKYDADGLDRLAAYIIDNVPCSVVRTCRYDRDNDRLYALVVRATFPGICQCHFRRLSFGILYYVCIKQLGNQFDIGAQR